MPPTRTKLPARERGGGGFGVRFLRVFPKEGSGAARSASPRPALPRLRCFRLGGAAAGRLRGALRVSMAKQLPSAFSPVPVVGQLLPFSARRGAVPCVVSCRVVSYRVVLCVTVSCSCCGIVCEQSRTVTQIPPAWNRAGSRGRGARIPCSAVCACVWSVVAMHGDSDGVMGGGGCRMRPPPAAWLGITEIGRAHV